MINSPRNKKTWRKTMLFIRMAIVCLMLIVTVACGVLSDKNSEEFVLAATEAGTPIGDKISRDIGPAGGTISSPDGRLTVTVPPNAVAENAAFTIQPISNKAEDGIGNAYRLEPSRRSFNTPVQLSFGYGDQDVEGTSPQSLRLSYQDEKGEWHQQNSTTLDIANKRVTVETKHFSDWTIDLGEYIKIIPAKADVYVGKSVTIKVRSCNFTTSILSWFDRRRKLCEERGWGSEAGFPFTLQGPGSLNGAYPNAIYTAPARKPIPNVATVVYRVPGAPRDIAELQTKITILDHSYRATGRSGALSFSGVICSLEEPFIVNGQSQLNFIFSFTPSSATAGSVEIGGSGYGVSISRGRGTYTVEGLDSDRPKLTVTGSFVGTHPGAGSATGGGSKTIDLVPLDTNECAQPTQQPNQPPRITLGPNKEM
jgi:hypothetical protein